MSETDYQRSRHPLLIALVVTALVIGGAVLLIRQQMPPEEASGQELVVYCAAGIRKPVAQLAKAYEEVHNVPVRLEYGSSGEMESKLGIDHTAGLTRADLFIPADYSFSRRTRDKGLTMEEVPLARFRLVVAGKATEDLGLSSVADLPGSGHRWVVCNPHAGVGKKTEEALRAHGLYEAIYNGKKSAFPRVPEAAAAIDTSSSIACGFIWDSTARQFGLRIYDLPELSGATATITANVVTSSTQPTAALRFARWLASRDIGSAAFAQHHFTPIEGDRWEVHPTIDLYAGGLNREAVATTIRAFEQREGCTVRPQYAGCGTLVAGIDAKTTSGGKAPDMFLTCDRSYLSKVADRYGDDALISNTRVVMLVKKGNPKNLQTLKDLARPDLKIATNDPDKSTLGHLSWELFRLYEVAEAIRANGTLKAYTPSAHEIISQMEASQVLDVGLVYEANCQHLSDRLEILPIDHPRATAVQNVAVAKDSDFPYLTGRLMQRLLAPESRERYLQHGFGWEGTE